MFWRSLYRRAIPELPAALIWISEACAEGWIEEKRLDELLCPYVEGYYYEDAEAVKHRRVYAMLVHLGMLCRGVTEDGRTVYRTTALADHLWENWPEPAQADTTGGLIVQPHFEILVPPECMTRFALDLGAFADPLRGDVVHVYRITRHSIRRSIERGWSGPAIVGWLKRNSVQEVPGNVEMQILQWADRT
ncbi:MAG: helicase-associated domain-containing protein [Alicyclobacillaceae bacterium]|nr:helicase-associated domain-containing protein [Alicyclobacillaceae bacterium]